MFCFVLCGIRYEIILLNLTKTNISKNAYSAKNISVIKCLFFVCLNVCFIFFCMFFIVVLFELKFMFSVLINDL